MSSEASSFSATHFGKTPFYNQFDYVQKTEKELSQTTTLENVSYVHNTESKAARVAKLIFSIIIFPIGIYNIIHALVGKIVVPSTNKLLNNLKGNPSNYVDLLRNKIVEEVRGNEGPWKYKRITVEVNGNKIDAMIIGKESTFNNGRWLLQSNGNSGFYEYSLGDKSSSFKHLLTHLEGNALVFNYPGAGANDGMPNRQTMTKTYQAMLNFLEDKQKGIGAKEIIGYGYSIGGGVQGDALLTHRLKNESDGIKYVFVKDRTFSNLSTAAAHFSNPFQGFLTKVFGWNFNSVESSKRLPVPEIIFQTAKVKEYTVLKNSDDLKHDMVISAEASLAKSLMDADDYSHENKTFIGMPEEHVDPFVNPEQIAAIIKDKLNPQKRVEMVA